MQSPAVNSHPVLAAEDTTESAREMLRAVARGGGVLVVQLLAAPVVEGMHVLEVSPPGEPSERFLAEPVAAPCDLGFPLRLAPYVDVGPAERPRVQPSMVPDLAFDSLPPRRSDSIASAPAEVQTMPQSGLDLGSWLITGSAGQQAGGTREIDQAWLTELSFLEDIPTFQAETVAILAPMAKLLRYGDAQMLSAVITTMRAVIKKENGVGRAKYAGRVLRFMRDPSRLVALVDAALGADEEPTPALKHVLLETQAAAADALCAGRLRHRSETARARFVTLTRAIGPAAMASLAGALQACLARGERTGDVVEDLLRATPPLADEAAGSAIVELLRGGPVATTTSAALAVLPYVWSERARPFVVSALGHPDPSVVLVAVNGLRHLGAIDEPVARRLDPLVTGMAPASDELRVAATGAIAGALPDARAGAAAAVSRAFAATPGMRASGALTVAQAQALLALGSPNAVAMIEQRAASSPENVRRALLLLLAPSR